ncbi:hypothetical protein JQ594_35910 [Bradyrhizobium manausense]|uniref:hypothetical protein n=1 Tax=Bradyrhizobium manausense TaxID=989370 RepID=UPI001BA8C072|nr:hypothetical protein [Bradyrhizobium manausense]MBR0691347.1 hypothetical protein [Bradyrhizobium manausense]
MIVVVVIPLMVVETSLTMVLVLRPPPDAELPLADCDDDVAEVDEVAEDEAEDDVAAPDGVAVTAAAEDAIALIDMKTSPEGCGQGVVGAPCSSLQRRQCAKQALRAQKKLRRPPHLRFQASNQSPRHALQVFPTLSV